MYTFVYIKNSFSDNLTSSFTIHEMDDCQCMILKEINIFASLIIVSDCQQPHQHILSKEKKKVSWYTNSKILFLKKKLELTELLKT